MERREFMAAAGAIAAVGLPELTDWNSLIREAMDAGYAFSNAGCPCRYFSHDDGRKLTKAERDACHAAATAGGWYDR